MKKKDITHDCIKKVVNPARFHEAGFIATLVLTISEPLRFNKFSKLEVNICNFQYVLAYLNDIFDIWERGMYANRVMMECRGV